MNRNFAKHLARGMWELDKAITINHGKPGNLRLYGIRDELSLMFTDTGFEFSDKPPAIRKRRP